MARKLVTTASCGKTPEGVKIPLQQCMVPVFGLPIEAQATMEFYVPWRNVIYGAQD